MSLSAGVEVLEKITLQNRGEQMQGALAKTFCTVAPNVCGSSVRNLLPVTLRAPKILRYEPRFPENLCTPAFSICFFCPEVRLLDWSITLFSFVP